MTARPAAIIPLPLSLCLCCALSCFAGALLWNPPAAAAQPAGPPAPGDQAQRAAQLEGQLQAKRERAVRRFRAKRAWKLTEALELDEATAARLFPILRTFDDRFMEIVRERAKIRRELRGEVDRPAPRAAKINPAIERELSIQEKIWKLNRARFAAVRKVLSPSQAARALLILPEIDRAIHRQLRAAMRRERRGKRAGRRERKARRQRRRAADGSPFANDY